MTAAEIVAAGFRYPVSGPFTLWPVDHQPDFARIRGGSGCNCVGAFNATAGHLWLDRKTADEIVSQLNDPTAYAARIAALTTTPEL